MEPILFAGLYILVLIMFVFVMLFGESELFANTPVASAHAFINGGACSHIEWCAAKLCGESGRQGLAGLETACCERPNPLVQLLFLAMLAGAYYLYLRDVFPLLPLPGLPSWHKWTGSAALGICFAFFLTASLSDPGYVTPDNVAAHCRLYPPDGVLFAPDAKCWTCGVAKPARSKHCKTCGRCVARFDHHCVWVNNCVGLRNMRWFLAFLLSTAAVSAYGAVLAALTICADMRRRDAWSVAYLDRETGRLVYVGDSWRVALGYIVSRYSSQVALVVFLGLAGWIVFGFCAYQLLRILQGVTTNESFKRREHLRAAALQRRLDAERAKQDAITERILAGGAVAHLAADQGSLQAGASVAGGTDVKGGETGRQGTRRSHGSSKAQSWSFWHWGRHQPQQQQQQEQEQQQQRAHGVPAGSAVGGHAASGVADVPRAAPVPLPANMYDRGAVRNLGEVLFPHYHLRQAAAEVKTD